MRIITASNLRQPSFAKRCWQSQCDYAERIGAQWNHYRIPAQHYPNKAKLQIILANTEPGERVLWLDWDVEMNEQTVDLSQRNETFLAFNVADKRPHEPFNNGLMLADHKTFALIKPQFDAVLHWGTRLREELIVQKVLDQLAIPYTLIPDYELNLKHHLGSKKYHETYPV
jgi:hypothetical protein